MKDSDMSKDQRKCAFDAQDQFQAAKKKLANFSDCLAAIHKFDLSVDQSGLLLRGQAIAKGLESTLADAHVELQELFVAFDEAMAQESTRRR